MITGFMALMHVKVMGKSLDDRFVFKLLLGVICTIILLVLVGQEQFGEWIVQSLVIWIAVTLIVVSLTYSFVEEETLLPQILMISIGVVMIVVFVVVTGMPMDVLLITMLQSVVWMTSFSLILDAFKRRIDK
jgi:hypothetical protein